MSYDQSVVTELSQIKAKCLCLRTKMKQLRRQLRGRHTDNVQVSYEGLERDYQAVNQQATRYLQVSSDIPAGNAERELVKCVGKLLGEIQPIWIQIVELYAQAERHIDMKVVLFSKPDKKNKKKKQRR